MYCANEITGGLGNKLFQLANTIAFSKRHGYIPSLHPDYVHNNSQTITPWNYFYRGLPVVRFDHSLCVLPGDDAGVFYKVEPISSPILFKGYYQSEKYFSDFSDIIYDQYKCPLELETSLKTRFSDLDKAVFIHFRRGDYVNHPYHWFDLTSYYRRSVKHFPVDSVFYIFSDDIEFCKKDPFVATLTNVRFVENLNEIESMWLMSLCGRGGICANSTFSWWGGWLNKQRDSSVKIIYPDKQFPQPFMRSTDLVPQSFIIEPIQ